LNFKKQIHIKISELSQYRCDTQVRRKISKNITLNKNMDGTFDTITSQIMAEHKIADNYSFIIKETCNDYTNLITDTSSRVINRFEVRNR